MSAHAYKKAPAPKEPARVSYVAAVRQYGDDWRCAFPTMARMQWDTIRHEEHEAALMRLMERGVLSRVEIGL